MQRALRLIQILFCALFGGIIVLLFGYSTQSYTLKVNFGVSNIWLLFCIFLFVLLVYLLIRVLSKRFTDGYLSAIRKYYSHKTVIYTTSVLFLIQIGIAVSIMFLPGWDAGAVFGAAYAKVDNQLVDYSHYFSLYPNNLFLLWIYMKVIKLFQMVFGSVGLSGCMLSLIVLNCVISSLTAILVFRTVHMLTGRNLLSWIGWFLYALIAGISPWFLIPYSDAVGIIFPILILYLYIKPQQREWLRWTLIGACFYIGLRIKPTSAIIFIAIVGVEFITKLRHNVEWRKFFCALIALAATVAVIHACYTILLVPSLNININKAKAFGPIHFIKMGMNDQTDGVYLEEDVTFSASFKHRSEQDAANIEVIKKRMENYGFTGFLSFLARKALINFNNGSFGWWQEGTFYVVPLNLNTAITPWLTSYYYLDGERYHVFLNISQALWLATVVGTFLFSFNGRSQTQNKQKYVSAVRLCLIGLVVYVMLFEARSRYLYTHLPIFIVSAVLGYQTAIAKANQMLKRTPQTQESI